MSDRDTSLSLIVGLGNPGSEYAQTRHNAGFWYVERLADKYNIPLKNDRLKALEDLYFDNLLFKKEFLEMISKK